LLIAGALVVCVLIGAFLARPQGQGVQAAVVTVAYAPFQTKLPETGIVQLPRTQTLAAMVSGNVGAILVHAGQHVSQGQLLATIDNPQLLDAEQTAHEAYLAAAGRARTAAQTNATLPAQNRSAVVQAQANLEQARFALQQAIQDQRAGAQTGLGYGGTSAAQQRAAADAAVAQRATDFSEAKRIADADRALLAQKAIARNTVDQDVAKLAQAQVAYDQARRDRDETYAQIARQSPVLSDRVQADRDAVSQAEAALAAARATAAQDKTGDVQAAQADAQHAYDDWRYAQDQLARTRIVAPFSGTVQTIASETGDTLRPLQPGDAISAGQELVTIAGDSGFVVRARVDEQDISQVRTGQRAVISGEDLGATSLAGHVTLIGAVAQKSDDPSNTARQIVTTIALDKTVPYLRDGMNVDVDIVTVDRPHVLALATAAIRHDDGGKPYVLVVRHGVLAKRFVTLGATNDTMAIVTSGVKPGETVVIDRNPALAAGTRVEPTTVPSTRPAASS
jgi:RND family efflux transporter MFP subunit